MLSLSPKELLRAMSDFLVYQVGPAVRRYDPVRNAHVDEAPDPGVKVLSSPVLVEDAESEDDAVARVINTHDHRMEGDYVAIAVEHLSAELEVDFTH